MKVFLIICAFMAAAINAVPQYGYRYDRNNVNTNYNHKESESFFNPGQQQQQQQHKSEHSYGGSDGSSVSGDKYLPPAAAVTEPIITKQFFLVSAPEEEQIPRAKHFVIGRPQKNYRVVFIKAPGPENTNLKLTAEYAPQEEKTVIYVLSKKGDDINIGEIPSPEPTQPTKPEVFFIKYKTPEEAAAAQKEIQEQYDYLGGTSEFNDQGTVPIKSVIGSLDGLAPDGGYEYRKVQNGINSPIKSYLHPPSRFYY